MPSVKLGKGRKRNLQKPKPDQPPQADPPNLKSTTEDKPPLSMQLPEQTSQALNHSNQGKPSDSSPSCPLEPEISMQQDAVTALNQCWYQYKKNDGDGHSNNAESHIIPSFPHDPPSKVSKTSLGKNASGNLKEGNERHLKSESTLGNAPLSKLETGETGGDSVVPNCSTTAIPPTSGKRGRRRKGKKRQIPPEIFAKKSKQHVPKKEVTGAIEPQTNKNKDKTDIVVLEETQVNASLDCKVAPQTTQQENPLDESAQSKSKKRKRRKKRKELISSKAEVTPLDSCLQGQELESVVPSLVIHEEIKMAVDENVEALDTLTSHTVPSISSTTLSQTCGSPNKSFTHQVSLTSKKSAITNSPHPSCKEKAVVIDLDEGTVLKLDAGTQTEDQSVYDTNSINKQVVALEIEMNLKVENLHKTVQRLENDLLEKSSKLTEVEKRWNKMKSGIMCLICMDFLATPFTLSCGHSFCYKCLLSWFSIKKECPTCRHKIRHTPTFSLSISLQVETFIFSDDWEADKEERLYYSNRHIQEKLVLQRIHDQEDIWNGMFPKVPFGTIHDEEDGVKRCVRCGWEVVDLECVRCGETYDPDHEDSGESVFGNHDTILSEGTLESDTESDDSFVVPDDYVENEDPLLEANNEVSKTKKRRITIASSDEEVS